MVLFAACWICSGVCVAWVFYKALQQQRITQIFHMRFERCAFLRIVFIFGAQINQCVIGYQPVANAHGCVLHERLDARNRRIE